MYCLKHRPLQVLTRRFIQTKIDEACPICTKKIKPENDRQGLYFLKTPCCQSLFHRNCLQTHALYAGYFFKCPMCNTTEEFVREMKTFGVYVPEKWVLKESSQCFTHFTYLFRRDASWELEEHAFEELYTPHNRCDAPTCLCPHGREYDKEATDWDIAVCRSCASHGSHVKCSTIPDSELQTWICSLCSVVEKKGNITRKVWHQVFIHALFSRWEFQKKKDLRRKYRKRSI